GARLGGIQARCASEGETVSRWRFGLVWRTSCLLTAYLAVASAVLLKGPIGAVLPGAVGLAYLLAEGELPVPWRLRAWWALGRRWGLWWGVPLVLGLTVPWFWWADAATGGELFRVFFWKHNFERGFGGSGTLAAHPWWF